MLDEGLLVTLGVQELRRTIFFSRVLGTNLGLGTGGIWIILPDLGSRPGDGFRVVTEKVPKPVNRTISRFRSALPIWLSTASNTRSVSCRRYPVQAETSLIRSCLFTVRGAGAGRVFFASVSILLDVRVESREQDGLPILALVV
jgi:hypothetical protein